MNRRGVKSAVMAAVLTASTAVGVGMAATPASASGNNGTAYVVGVQGVPADGSVWQCPLGNFCLWTGTYFTGTMFPLYYCGTYSLVNWYGDGSVYNNQTGNPPPTAYLLYQNKSVDMAFDQTMPGNALWNFAPDWYAQPC